MSASIRFPARGLSHRFPKRCLPVFPLAALAEEMPLRLHCSASAPPAHVILGVRTDLGALQLAHARSSVYRTLLPVTSRLLLGQFTLLQ
jgi:hypothetical protein